FSGGHGERVGIPIPKVNPVLNACFGKKQFAVGMPGFGFVGLCHGFENLVLDSDVLEYLCEFSGAEMMFAAHVPDEGLDVRSLSQVFRSRSGRGKAAEENNEQDEI